MLVSKGWRSYGTAGRTVRRRSGALLVVCKKEQPYPITRKRPRRPLHVLVSVAEYTRRMNVRVKRGDILGMERVFNEMCSEGIRPNAYSYSTRMNGYSRIGDLNKVFQLFDEMLQARIKPNTVVYGTMIRACSGSANLTEALRLFNEMQERYGLVPDVIVYSQILSVCAKAKDCHRARNLFTDMKMKGVAGDVVAYTTLIDAYAECSTPENGKQHLSMCLSLLDSMKAEKLIPNDRTYDALIKICTKSGQLDDARGILYECEEQGIRPSVVSYNQLIDGHGKARQLSEALAVFDEMQQKGIAINVVTYNSLIDAYAESSTLENGKDHLNACLSLVDTMKRDKLTPDLQTFSPLIKVCTRSGRMEEAARIVDAMRNKGIRPGVVIYCQLIDGYAKDHRISPEVLRESIDKLLSEMQQHGIKLDAPAHNSLLNAFVAMKDMHRAERCFIERKKSRIKPDAITYATMIKCYERLGDPSRPESYLKPCYDVLAEMDREGIPIRDEGYMSLMNALANGRDLEAADRMWNRYKEDRTVLDVRMFTAMIKACLATDALDRAYEIMDEMRSLQIAPDDHALLTFFTYFLQRSLFADARKLFETLALKDRPCGKNLENAVKKLKLSDKKGELGPLFFASI